MSATTIEQVSSFESRAIVTFIIFLLSLIGVFSNVLVFLFATTIKSLQNSFGRLSASQSFAEAILCAVFLFFYCPMVFLDLQCFKLYSAYIGLILLFCYDVCIFSHLFIAFNRFCAIARPFQYERIFNAKNTKILISIAYIVPCFTSIYIHLTNNCLLPYVDNGWYFGVNTSKSCDSIRFFIDFSKDFGVIALIAIIDISTILMIRWTASSFNLVYSSSSIHRAQIERREKEIKFVKQALLQGFAFATELIFFFIISRSQTRPELLFLCTTFSWIFVHTFDPLVIIILNSEFRKMLAKKVFNYESFPAKNEVSHDFGANTVNTR